MTLVSQDSRGPHATNERGAKGELAPRVSEAFRAIDARSTPKGAVDELLSAGRALLSGTGAVWLLRRGRTFEVAAHIGLDSSEVAAWKRDGPRVAAHVSRGGLPSVVRGGDLHSAEGTPSLDASPAPAPPVGVPVTMDQGSAVLFVIGATASAPDQVDIVRDLADFTGARIGQQEERSRLSAEVERLARQLAEWERTVSAVEDMSNSLLRGEDLEHALGIAAARLGTPIELQRIVDPENRGPRDALPDAEDISHESAIPVPGTSAAIFRLAGGSEAARTSLAAIARITGLELSRQRAILETELRLRDGLIRSLVEGDWSQLQSMWQQAALVGIDLTRPKTPVVLGGNKSPVSRETLDRVSQAVQRRHRTVELTTFEGTVVILWPTEDFPTHKALAAEVDRLLGELHLPFLSAGIGSVCTRSQHYPDAVREALFAQQLSTGGGTERVICAADLGMYRLFAHVGGITALRTAVDESLGPLLEADEQEGSDLVYTLRTFLQNDRRMTETARVLFVHVNTLRYRIERISRLLKTNLDDADTRFMLQLALRLAPVVGHVADGASPPDGRTV